MEAKNKVVKGVREKLLSQLTTIMEMESLASETARSAEKVQDKQLPLSRDIFIVHGHDEEMKQHVARTITTLGFTPIILHEMPNGGRTIIEKFEHNAIAVDFAIVLLSPDDKAFSAKGTAKDAVPRARQNVILELGYFAGSLGRDHVFCLKRSDLEVPSDFSGVVYTTYDAGGSWKMELVRELVAVGFSVDANRLLPS